MILQMKSPFRSDLGVFRFSHRSFVGVLDFLRHGADWKNAPNFRVELTNQKGARAWPITGVTYIVLKKEQKNKDLAGRMLQYFDWCFREGGKTASAMHYVPMPAEVVALVKASWKEVK